MTLLAFMGVAAAAFLAFSNGANDNFKGVATLLGSKTATYNTALWWATITTLAGSAVAVILAQKLLVNFSGKGLVPDEVTHLAAFPVAVALAAALTVFLATRIGFPISTTHAMTGALVGAGLLASSSGVNFEKLMSAFVVPLLLSPVLAVALATALYPVLSYARKRVGMRAQSCLCIGQSTMATAPAAMVATVAWPEVVVGTTEVCEQRYAGRVVGIEAKTALDGLHFLSAGTMSFARGLNDTPKIAAILLLGSALAPGAAITIVGVLIAIGGLLYARRIAQTMAYQITEMNEGQGFTANLITSTVVLGASTFGMPVSTTHVSCGAIFGIGAVSGQAKWKTIGKIVMAWVTTLPIAGALGALLFLGLNRFI
jgi:PiT family inorganic phosphate transporter